MGRRYGKTWGTFKAHPLFLVLRKLNLISCKDNMPVLS